MLHTHVYQNKKKNEIKYKTSPEIKSVHYTKHEITFSPTNGNDHVNTSIKFGSQ